MQIKFASQKTKEVLFLEFSPKKVGMPIVQKEKKTVLTLEIPATTLSYRQLSVLARKVVRQAKQFGWEKIMIDWPAWQKLAPTLNASELAECLATNWELANFDFIKYKTEKKEYKFIKEIIVRGLVNPVVKQALRRGQIIGQETNSCRDLANTPGGDITPTGLAKIAKEHGRNLPIKVKVLDEIQMAKLGMGGILGVTKGSSEPAKFIVMEYFNGGKAKPVVLVGKGVTFDTGGLNLKPSEAIYEMHMDMSGGAAVMHAVVVAARLKLKINVVALIPAAENMPSGSSYRPGDILKTLSGLTVEVLNTDAEGRLLLADGLAYAKKYQPRIVIDVATLTGAAMVALGDQASAIFANDDKLIEIFQKIGESSGDYVWPLPLWEEYTEQIKGTFADLANIGKTRYGGAITGAVFLQQFAKDFPWVHLDIAPRMTAAENDNLAKGAAAPGVRLLVKYLMSI